MAKNIASVTGWLLKQSPNLVKKLERDGDMIRVRDEEKLGLKNVKLLVPPRIDVYQVIQEVRNKGLFFFTARANKDTAPAYCSYVEDSSKSLNFMRNAGILLMYPWYSNADSSEIFQRIATANKKTNLYLITCKLQREEHPFIRELKTQNKKREF